MKNLLLLSALLLGVTSAAHAQNFKIATLSPDGSFWTQEIRKAADDIAQKTNNRVTLRLYPGGVMGNDADVLRKIRINQLQGGALTTGSISGAYGDAAVYGMPFKFEDFAEIDYVRKNMDKQILQGIESGGMVPFGLAEGGFAYIMSKKPIRTVADLRSAKVWAPTNDDLSIQTLRALGVTPVPLSLGDVLPALQTGIVDTVATSPVGALALQWHTAVSYVTDMPLVYFSGVMVIDQKAFKKAKPEDQKIVRAALTQAFEHINTRNRADNVAAFEALKNQGIEVVEPQDMDAWHAIRDVALDVNNRIKMFSPAGLKTVDEHLARFRNQQAKR
jgi:TRAP-type C4-dicarboxylate transport system substrate-binding protein